MTQRRTFLGLVASAALLNGTQAMAQATFPTKPIRWVVGTAAGGGSDFVVRTVAHQLSQQLGQQIIVDNRPGGGTTIAADLVARSAADGYTLLTADTGTIVFNTALFKNLSYKPMKDLAPVGMLAHFPLLLVTHPNSGFSSAQAAIEAIRRSPGVHGYASAGVGSPHHIAMEFAKDQAKLDVRHVPYKGAAPAVQDLVGGVVPFGVIDSAAGLPMIRAGKLKALATFTKTRVAAFPDVPTLIELGYTLSEAPCWIAMVAPAGTPQDVIARLSAELAKALSHPDVQKKLRDVGLEPQPSSPAQLMTVWQQADAYWPPLIRSKGITID